MEAGESTEEVKAAAGENGRAGKDLSTILLAEQILLMLNDPTMPGRTAGAHIAETVMTATLAAASR